MTPPTTDAWTDVALRALDPAPASTLNDAEIARAQETLDRILSVPRDPTPAPERPARPRRRRLLVATGIMGATGIAVPALFLGGSSAFASWTPTPERLSSAAAAQATTTCRAVLGVPDRGAPAVLAERRGGWTYAVLAGPQEAGFCLMPDELVGHRAPAEQRADIGFFGGYSSDPEAAPTLSRDSIQETEAIQGSVPADGFWPFSEDGWFSLVGGYVGSGVTGVTVHTPVGTDVEASVANGRFAAWWPSDMPNGDNLAPMGAWTYTLTLADGSSLTTSPQRSQ